MEEETKKVAKLDDIDIKILKIINDDVKTSYRNISTKLGISVGTVHNRLEKMISIGVITKFAPILNHESLGYKLTSIIGVKIKGNKVESWERKIAEIKNVVGIYDVTGEYDAFLITKFKNLDELDGFIKNMQKEPVIERTYTQTVLNVVKEDMNSANIL